MSATACPLDTDRATRRAVAGDLDSTLFVNAGAGSGKTTALVDRVSALVASGVPIPCIAAITFTEKAAAELRERVRRRLTERAATAEPQQRPVFEKALEDLDAAAIGTLHAFAQRLLVEHPTESGLPPRFEVHDEIGSGVAFDRRWRRFRNELFADPSHATTLRMAMAVDVRLDSDLRRMAELLDQNWDLVAERLDGELPPEPEADLGPWLGDVACLDRHLDNAPPEDRMTERLQDIAVFADEATGLDPLGRLELVEQSKGLFTTRLGHKKNWGDVLDDVIRPEVAALGERLGELLADVKDGVLARLLAVVGRFVLEAADDRRAQGSLDFHDLLVLARLLLRGPNGTDVRSSLRRRYERLLLDEFQDTDPIQLDLAVLLASPEPAGPLTDTGELEVDPGRLFFVGDPKQSIYRFRRADVAMFLAAEQRFSGDSQRLLTRNFRTAEPVLEWVNHVFATVIRPEAGRQPAYLPLEPVRKHAPPHGPPVTLLGTGVHADEPTADELRDREAADIASSIVRAVEEGWSVGDGEGGWRPAQLGDVCVLLPARTSLYALTAALDAAGVPYRAETSSLVYATPEVRALFATLRAVDDASDQLSLVTALRSPLFGCGDDDLYTFRRRFGGRWDISSPIPDSVPNDHPVREAIECLASWHRQRHWRTPSALLDEIIAARRLRELGVVQGGHRDLWRRLAFIVDQARAFAESEGGSLRDFVAWASRQARQTGRSIETTMPETDDDSVRIMTIHAAKGLEFPIVLMSGMTTAMSPPARGVQVVFPEHGGVQVRIRKGAETADFDEHRALDEQLDVHERRRLLYVAATRARDHLVVSTHRRQRPKPCDDPANLTAAETLFSASSDFDGDICTDPPAVAGRLRATDRRDVPAVELLSRADWERQRENALHRAAQPRHCSATAVAAGNGAIARDHVSVARLGVGAEENARDAGSPAWQHGRLGAAVGRAVHGTLQLIDLRTGEALAETSAAQAAAEGLLGLEEEVEALSRSALESRAVRRAAHRSHWRETYVATTVDGVAVEGYVDLLYRDDDGLVVVDYKTDALEGDGAVAAKVSHYRLQLATYALAVREATGEPVVRAELVFCTPCGPVEAGVADLAAAIEEARGRVSGVGGAVRRR